MSTLDQHTEPCNPLMVPDLLYIILDCLSPATDQREALALVALAQTCRALSEPSLDRLWKELRSLKPLIRCYTRADDVENAIPPTSFQLAIIDRYAYRVKELTIFDRASVRFLQCTSMRPCFLLPNLMVLRWSSSVLLPPIHIAYIQRLLSPTLVSLRATLAEADGPTLLSFFDNYPLLCRNLRSVEFRFSKVSPTAPTIQALSRAICNQETLKNVVLRMPIDDIALRHLSTLPALKALTIDFSERSQSRTPFLLPTDPLFCNIEELEFRTSDLDLITSLLHRDHTFHTFSLCHRGRLTSEALVAFLNVLISRSSTKPLQRLSLSAMAFSNPTPVDQMASEATRYHLSYATLQPLMVLGALLVLEIQWSEQISLDDDEVVRLARSWPRLQVFCFYCERGGYPPFTTKYATLKGLLSLVRTCPALRKVSLPLDATHVPDLHDGEAEAEACETHFSCLVVPQSPIGAARPVAEFLYRYLPCVTAVTAGFRRLPGVDVAQIMVYEGAWDQVEMDLEALHGLSSDQAV